MRAKTGTLNGVSCLSGYAGAPVPERQRLVAAARQVCADAGRLVGQTAVQLHGGIGVTDELDVAHYFIAPDQADSEVARHAGRLIDLPRCPVEGAFTGQQVRDAISQHTLAEARKNPAGFAELAKKNSQDTASAPLGGDLEFSRRGAMATSGVTRAIDSASADDMSFAQRLELVPWSVEVRIPRVTYVQHLTGVASLLVLALFVLLPLIGAQAGTGALGIEAEQQRADEGVGGHRQAA